MNKKVIALVVSLMLIVTIITSVFLTTNLNAASTQNYTWKNVVTGGGGGYVPAIIFSQKQKDLIYARTDMGGAYRWEPSTNSWTQLLAWIGFDDWSLNGVESIAADPVIADRVYMAVGTYTNSWSPSNGAILRSDDQGKTFKKFDLPFKCGSNMPARNTGERLVIDPNKNSILYLGARSGKGLWKSTDSGETWSKVTTLPNPGTFVQDASNEYLSDCPGVLWVTIDPKSGSSGNASNTIYVGVAEKKKESIYRSNDGGASWEAISGQPTGYLPHHGYISSGMLYVTYSDGQGPYDGSKGDVYKFDIANKTWKNISPIPSTSSDCYFGYGGLALDAKNPNTLMVATLNSWWPDAIIFRSLDGGTTWSRIWNFTSYPSRELKYTMDISNAPWLNFGVTKPIDPVPAVKLGWMIGGLFIDPFNSDRMMYGTGATIYGCNDLTNWDKGEKINIKSTALGVEEASVQDLISPPSGANLYSALGDIGGFKHDDFTKSPSEMYSVPFAGTNHTIDYAELNPKFMVRAGVGDKTVTPPQMSTGFTYDGGATWFSGNSDIGGITGGGTIAAAADASVVVWAPTGGVVAYSKDNGNSWVNCSGLPSGVEVRSDRVNPKKFYAFADGKFYISQDAGATFTKTSASNLPSSSTKEFKAVPGIEGDIWLTGTGGMWHSTDSGTTFTKISVVDQSDTIGFGKAAPGQSYMAIYTSSKINGVRGIFRSDDKGVNWIRINDDQHQYGCTNSCITGDPRVYGRVYLGTNGLGIVYGDLNGSVTTSVDPTKSNATTSSVTTTPTTTTSTSTILLGDINKDGRINSTDSALVERYIMGAIDFNSDQLKAADTSKDGKITTSDTAIIIRYTLGSIDKI